MDTPIVKAADNKSAIEKVEEQAKKGLVLKNEEIKTVEKQIKDETSKAKSDALQARLNKAIEENAKNAVANYVADALNTDYKFDKIADSRAIANDAVAKLPEGEVKKDLAKQVVDATIVRDDYEAVTAKEDIETAKD